MVGAQSKAINRGVCAGVDGGPRGGCEASRCHRAQEAVRTMHRDQACDTTVGVGWCWGVAGGHW